MKVRIRAESAEVEAEIYENTKAGKLIAEALPIEGRVNRWGDEIYFAIPVRMEEFPDAKSDVEVGDLGYWPPGSAFCIFFGPTPVSTGNKPRAYSPVNLFGRVIGDATVLRKVKDGEKIVVEKIE